MCTAAAAAAALPAVLCLTLHSAAARTQRACCSSSCKLHGQLDPCVVLAPSCRRSVAPCVPQTKHVLVSRLCECRQRKAPKRAGTPRYLAGLANVCSLCSRPVPVCVRQAFGRLFWAVQSNPIQGQRANTGFRNTPCMSGARVYCVSRLPEDSVCLARGNVCLQLSSGTSVLAHTSNSVRACPARLATLVGLAVLTTGMACFTFKLHRSPAPVVAG